MDSAAKLTIIKKFAHISQNRRYGQTQWGMANAQRYYFL